MKVWAIANQKGGVGKTTTTVNLGGWLARYGQRTLLVDMDPHGSLTAYFGHNPDQVEVSVHRLFQANAQAGSPLPAGIVKKTAHENLFLMPASTAMATLDRQIGNQDGKGLVLANALKHLSDYFDYVMVDCPPILGVLMVNALAAGERLIIPVQTEFLALKGLERMMRTVGMVIKARKTPLQLTIVPTMFDRRTSASIEALRQLRAVYPAEIWNSVIPVDTKLREASRNGVPLAQMMPRSRGAIAYQALLHSLVPEDVPPPESAPDDFLALTDPLAG
ncbi:MAG: ParA family protein [Pseudomonadota bacterium]